MKRIVTKGLSLLTVLAIAVSLFAGLSLSAGAVSYSTSSNSGKRGEVCTSLPASATSYYGSTYSYDTLSNRSSSALLTALRTLMTDTHKTSTSYNDCKKMAYKTDCQQNNGKVTLLYCGYQANSSDFSGSAPGWNREHVWPQSLGGFKTSGAGADLHHVRPDDVTTNGDRGNKRYGPVSGGTASTATISGANNAVGGYYNSNYYEPIDAVKGDVARICMYVYTRYGNQYAQCSSITNVFQSKAILLEWCKLDPVDTWEMGRNEVVQSIQGNRNVFIDYPEYAWLLFDEEIPTDMVTPSGKAMSTAPSYTVSAVANNASWGTVSVSGMTVTATPASGYQVDGATVTPSGAATLTRSGNTFTVSNLTANVTVTVNFSEIATTEPTTPQPTVEPTEPTEPVVVPTESTVEPTVTPTAPTVEPTEPTVEPTEPIVEPTEAHTHSYTASVTAPTCLVKGYTTYTCACGESYRSNFTDTIDHNYTSAITLAPTATTAGEMTYTCTVCGTSYTEVIPATDDGKEPTEPSEDPLKDFTDLPEGAWYEEGVRYALENSLMNGVGDNKFEPDETLTRAMLVTILYRAENTPDVTGLANPFTDVSAGEWYTDAVIWAADNGIVKGMTETTFEPMTAITREQMATILYRYAGSPEVEETDLSSFIDGANVQSYAVEAMQWAVAEGIIGGTEENGQIFLDPQGNATRAQIATILMRYLEK